MEQSFSDETPTLWISQFSKYNLMVAARWAKFLSIMGFILCGIMVIASFFMGALLGSMNSMKSLTADPEFPMSSSRSHNYSFLITLIYLIFSLLYFFPTLYLNRFANKLKLGIQANDQGSLEGAFENIAKMFRFIGVMTVILLVLYGVIIICTVALALFIAR